MATTTLQSPTGTDAAGDTGDRPWLRWGLVAAVTLLMLYAATALYALAQPLFGTIVLVLALVTALIFGSDRFYAQRFIFPGIAAVALFIAFPVIYTVWLGFTNYSSFNLLDFERATEVQLASTIVEPGTERAFSVVPDGDRYRLFFPEGGGGLLSEPVALDGEAVEVAAEAVDAPPAETLEMREAIRLRDGLGAVTVVAPDGTGLVNTGLRSFASATSEFVREADGRLVSSVDGTVLTPDHERGFYVDGDGRTRAPGWRTFVGLENFERIFTSEGIRAPLFGIFVWTVTFALLSTVLVFAVGVALATLLQWEHLAFRGLYRLLLILPYAVPAFISILVFRGLFNQNFGEINLILNALFGIRPDWFTDGGLARTMILIVNVWLGYPYMMLLAMGFLQSVPGDHKKAAALEGASSVRIFFTITLPQIVPPFLPLLIATFAFNFNNFVLILLLTSGGPDIPGTVIPAGETDILGSFTYRLAFLDSGQQFGLSGAITLIIFLIVAALAYANFVALRRAAAKRFQGAA